MGIGNYFLTNAETVYIYNDQVYGEWDEVRQEYSEIEHRDDYPFFYQDLMEALRGLLPASYRRVDRVIYEYREARQVIAENGFYAVSIIEWGGVYFALNVEILPGHETSADGLHPLAKYHLRTAAQKVFDRLVAAGFALSVRTSGYTSGPYVSPRHGVTLNKAA